MKNPTLLYDKTDINDFLRGYWRTPEFKNSHDNGGLVSRIVKKYAHLPRFFYEMSDEYLERAHFSIWWSGIALRDYAQDSCHDLYMLHELAHGADMVHIAGQHSEGFRRKMQDNELLASVTTEVVAYFDMPTLRPRSFTGEIFADRFLSDPALQARWREDPERLQSELYYRRRNAMFYPARHDPIEMWLHGFTMQNDKWFGSLEKAASLSAKLLMMLWISGSVGLDLSAHATPVAVVASVMINMAMENLTRASALGKRREALLRHMDWVESMSSNGIPFRTEAEKFAEVYWEGREKPAVKAA